ncbi:MAG: hypothetical protein ABIH23_19235 [bacterium]
MMGKTFEFSDDELELIQDWYLAAAGESASGSGEKAENDKLRALLGKLKIEPHSMDQYQFDHEDHH